MPTQTRSQAKQSQRGDRVDQYSVMFPAFVTAPVPLAILDELIDEAWEGACGLTDNYEDPPGGCLCIITTEDLGSIGHGSRKPMQPFESPFLGMTDDEVRTWFLEHQHPGFSYFTFAVLDKDTVKNKTCRIGYRDVNAEEDNKMVITDFYASIYIQIPLDVVVISWFEEVRNHELVLGPGKAYTRKHIEEEKQEVADRPGQAPGSFANRMTYSIFLLQTGVGLSLPSHINGLYLNSKAEHFGVSNSSLGSHC
ncbi:hypothetical protein V490_01129 [Pseudogymnoascus sp. VKM F-3557]|nr:hypothetical protein V490_01129 [Pseudogymnoascus sp. VKM F-3557]